MRHDWCCQCVARQVQTEGKFNGFKGLRLAVTTINGSRYCGICAAREIPSPEKLAAIVVTEARALFQGFLETLSDEVYGRFEHELQRSESERGDAGTAVSDGDPAVPTSPLDSLPQSMPLLRARIEARKRSSSERDGMGI